MPFALASFLGALTLFFLQPMLGKAVTPWFGGSAPVWLGCLVLFQGLLLLGYAYAHGLQRLPGRLQAGIHLGLLALAAGLALALQPSAPFLPARAWAPLTTDWPGLAAVTLVVLAAGLPLTLLSATSPLLQAWWARHRPEAPAYRLYAASNLGSLLGLLAYPLLAEPFLDQRQQASLALGMFLGFGALASLCAVSASRGAAPAAVDPPGEAPPRTWPWVVLSGAGSALLMGASNLLGSDVQSIPLVWVLPLATYLATFILVFGERLPLQEPGVRVALLAVLGLGGLALPALQGQRAALPLVTGVLALVASGGLLLHGFLYDLRPAPARLTRYYLAIALGGLLGGLFTTALAPRLFSRTLEFPLALALAAVGGQAWLRQVQGPGRLRVVVGLLACAGAFAAWLGELSRPGAYFRDAYTVVGVAQLPDRSATLLLHGRTLHGILDPRQPLAPMAYHGPHAGSALAFATQRARKGRLRVGIVGLGLGNAFAFLGPGDTVRVYELSPAILRLAGPRGTHFPALRASGAEVSVALGDGRFLLEAELARGGQGFDLLLVDAFAGANLPWHLLTVEAFRTYLGHLAPDGLLVVNVTNTLPLDRLVAAAGRAHGLWGLAVEHPSPRNPAPLGRLERHSRFVVLSREAVLVQDGRLWPHASWLIKPSGAEAPPDAPPEPLPLRPWSDARNALVALLWAPTEAPPALPAPRPRVSSR